MKIRKQSKPSSRKTNRKRYKTKQNVGIKTKWRFRILLGFIVLLLFLKFKSPKSKTLLKTDENDDIPSMAISKETKNNHPWTEFDPPIVTKQQKRTCKITKIDPQIIEPLVYLSKNSKTGDEWKRRAVACIDGCSGTLKLSFESRGFKNIARFKEKNNIKVWDATFIFLNQKTLENLYEKDVNSFNELVFHRESVTYVNTVLTSQLLLGQSSKGATTSLDSILTQQHRVLFSEEFGCKYPSLGIESTEKLKYLTMNKYVPIIQAHVALASTYPFFVFSRLSTVQVNKKHISIEAFQNFLADNKLTGSHYIDTLLYSTIKKSALFVFHSMRQSIVRRKGSFLFLTLNYKITEKFQVYLNNIEYNTELKENSFLQEEFDEMFDLIQELHEIPVVFNSMVKGDKYGGWELLFSEKQETCDQVLYNPCTTDKINQRNLKKANSKVAKIHNTANRKRHEEARVVKKTEEQKKNMCRKKKLGYPSSKCDRHQKALDSEKFEALFEEHELSFNPYQFIMPKPGEVFSWEKV